MHCQSLFPSSSSRGQEEPHNSAQHNFTTIAQDNSKNNPYSLHTTTQHGKNRLVLKNSSSLETPNRPLLRTAASSINAGGFSNGPRGTIDPVSTKNRYGNILSHFVPSKTNIHSVRKDAKTSLNNSSVIVTGMTSVGNSNRMFAQSTVGKTSLREDLKQKKSLIEVKFEFEYPSKLSKAQIVKRNLNWNKLPSPYSNTNAKKMPVARSLRPNLPRRAISI